MKAFKVKSLGALQHKNIPVGDSKFSKNIFCRLEIKSELLLLKHAVTEGCLSFLTCVVKPLMSSAPLIKRLQGLCLFFKSLSQPLGVKDYILPPFADEGIGIWGH